jgi:hypothetical protein
LSFYEKQDIFENLEPFNDETEQIFKTSQTEIVNRDSPTNAVIGAVNYQPTGGEFFKVSN